MTIANATNKSGPYFYNGAATSFAYGFKIDDASHIRVVETVIATGVETDLTLNSDYTVTGVGADTGNVVIAPARAAGRTVVLVRNVPFTQSVALENQGAYFAKVVEGALDRGVARDQQLQEQISRAVVVPISADASDYEAIVEDILRLGDSAAQIDIVAANIDAVIAVPSYMAEIDADRQAAETAAANSAASAAASEVSRQAFDASAASALSYSGIAQGAAATALAAAADAEDLVEQATAGFVGFIDGSGYDFGSIATPSTYFNRDFGSIA